MTFVGGPATTGSGAIVRIKDLVDQGYILVKP